MLDQIRTESVLNQLPMKPPDILKILKMMMNDRSDQNIICIELVTYETSRDIKNTEDNDECQIRFEQNVS